MVSESINSTKTGISISLLCFGPFWPFEVHQKRSAIFYHFLPYHNSFYKNSQEWLCCYFSHIRCFLKPFFRTTNLSFI